MTHDHAPAKADAHLKAAKAADSDTDIPESTPIGAYAGVDPATVTHAELTELILTAKGWRAKKSAAYNFRSYVSTWCKALGLTEGDAAHRSLGRGFEGRLTAVTDNLAERSKHTARNVRWAARYLKKTYESIRTNANLPLDFAEALKQSLQARGWGTMDLCKAIGWPKGHGSIYGYVAGAQAPRWPQSMQIVVRIEKALELPKDTLVSRAFRRPRLIRLGSHTPIPYREWKSRLSKYPYGLKELPEQFKDFWLELAYWRSQPTLRVDGETYVPEFLLWTKNDSQLKYNANLRRFMGFLTLKKPTKPLSALTLEERWMAGKGMKPENIRLSHVFDVDLIWEFFEFLRARQHNGKYTQDHSHYVQFLNSLVNHAYAYVKAHPELAPLFERKPMTRPKWIAFTEAIHQKILKVGRDLRKASKGTEKQRSADEPLIEVFKDADPTKLFMQLVDQLSERMPGKSQVSSRSVHMRDVALILLCIEQPLRARNLSELEIGSSLVRDNETGLWRLLVPKEAMKNKHSKYSKGVYCILSKKTSEAIDLYLKEGRPNLKGANKSRLFLLPGPSGPKPKPGKLTGEMPPERLGVSPDGVYWIIQRRTEDAFGFGLGSNVFRHLLPTSILKDDPGAIELCAAKLDNSPKTVTDNYKHLTRSDHLARAKRWFDEKQRQYEEERKSKQEGSRRG